MTETLIVLFILTSAEPGYWGEELAVPVNILQEHGIQIEYASPQGKAKLDPLSAPDPDQLPPDHELFKWTSPEASRKVMALDRELLKNGTRRLEEVHGYDYAAVVVVGGHGSMFDVNQNPEVHRILREAYDRNKIVAAECHGTGALAFAGLISGKKVTGFPEAWEPPHLKDKLPYSLQEELHKASGGNYEDGLEPGVPPKPLVIAQGNILTSRDPMSSEAMGFAILEKLGAAPPDIVPKKVEINRDPFRNR
ncbi:MAG: type 1 glutamine amidotransferase domain-containing protein [Elusimicrobia bacterium]|nr:type 1 glutamine amidotransferase domain-containing protein [Elusimicrobiota bacterium]